MANNDDEDVRARIAGQKAQLERQLEGWYDGEGPGVTAAPAERELRTVKQQLQRTTDRLAVYVRGNRQILRKHGWLGLPAAEHANSPDVLGSEACLVGVSPMLRHPCLPGGVFDDRTALDAHLTYLTGLVDRLQIELGRQIARAARAEAFRAEIMAAIQRTER